MANAKLFLNTGFTAINLPYNKQSLVSAAASTIDLPPLDLIQIFELTSVRVKAFENQIMDADYLELSNVSGDTTYTSYYVITGYQMAAMDVAVLDIVPDPALTCGGIGAVQPVTGIYNRYGGQRPSGGVDRTTMLLDNLMQPSVRANYKYKAIGDFTEHMPSNGRFIVASSIDLTKVPADALDQTVAYTYDDSTGQLKFAFVPTPSLGTAVYIKFPAEFGGGMVTTMTPGYGLYDYNDPAIEAAVQSLRAYGYENAIIGVYRIPDGYMDAPSGAGDGHTFINVDGFYNGVAVTAEVFDTGFKDFSNLYEGADLKTASELLPYSPSFQIGLMSTATGSRIEKRVPDVTGQVVVFSDPRPDGGPIFILPNRPAPENATPAELAAYRVAQIQSCSIQGATWDRVPIIYEGASGSQKDYMRLTMAEGIANANYEIDLANNQVAGMTRFVGAGARTLSGFGVAANPVMGQVAFPDLGFTEHIPANYDGPLFGARQIGTSYDPYVRNAGAIGTGGSGMLGAMYDTAVRDEQIRNQRLQSSKRNMQEFAINNRLVAPAMAGKMVEGIQQYLGNGCVAYIIYPDAKDLRKYAAVAASFGLAVDEFAFQIAVPAGKSVYVQGNGITVEAQIPVPNGVRDDVGALLEVGARFWKTRPVRLTINDYVGGGTT